MTSANLQIKEESPARVALHISYEIKGADARPVSEEYIVSAAGVECASTISPDNSSATRIVLPVMASDGVRQTVIQIDGNKARVQRVGGVLTWEVTSAKDIHLNLIEPKLVTHNGYVQAAVADLPAGANEARWTLKLEPDSSAK